MRVSRKERENISAFPKAKAGVDCKKKKKEELDDDDDNEEERDIASIIFSTVHRVLHLNTLTHSFMVEKRSMRLVYFLYSFPGGISSPSFCLTFTILFLLLLLSKTEASVFSG